jgi:aminoglycoside/choline kinase family phosphotransferase
MRPGLAEYDLASLLYDPYVSLTADERLELVNFYCTQADGGEPDLSLRLSLCAMQRLMQALGAYGFLGLVKAKEEFLAYVPAAMRSLREILGEIDGLEPLASAMQKFTA